MARVLVLGGVTSFRRIVVSALRSRGLEARDADIDREGLSLVQGEKPDIVVLHLQANAMDEAYFERISIAVGGGRIVVVEESGPLALRSRAPEGVAFLSRSRVDELLDSVRRLADSREQPNA
jgi:CheY-like chemotaxis protein